MTTEEPTYLARCGSLKTNPGRDAATSPRWDRRERIAKCKLFNANRKVFPAWQVTSFTDLQLPICNVHSAICNRPLPTEQLGTTVLL